MEARAIAKTLLISPFKARLTVDMIRGKNVVDALNILNNTNNKAARLTIKVLNSAIANAVNNNGAKREELYVKEARVDGGPVLKRHMFDSRSHIGHNDKSSFIYPHKAWPLLKVRYYSMTGKPALCSTRLSSACV